VYEIYSYGNSDALFGIFNAVAALVGANGYTGALAITVTAGFITALLAYAFAPDKLNGWKWLAGVVLIYSVLLVPRVNVGIVDKLGNQPVKVVANVPLGLGLLGHFTNVVGNTLTELFETALQVIPGDGALPLELSYQQHGLMFGTRLVKETRSVVFLDPAFRTDLINFVHNCTMFDLADGTVDPKAFATSVDVWTLMGNPNPARFSTLTTNGNVDVQPCPGVYVNLSARMPTAIDRLREHLAYALNVGLDPANAVAAINGEIETAYIKNKLANAGVAAADILRQNALINAIGDTSQIIGQKLNDPAALLLGAARAQSSASTNLWYIASGRMAEQALPLVRNVLEALIYALFPLVLLLVMLTSGRTTGMALKAYAVAFIWIQLWPPIYAIFNYMGILATAKDLAAAADLGGGLRGMALQTAAGIYTNAISNQAVVGNLVVSIPIIAWYALKGLEQVGQAAFSGLAGLQSAIGSAAQQAAAGNMSLGNLAFDQAQLAPNRSSAYMRSSTDATGTSYENITDPRSYRRDNRLGSNVLNIADMQEISAATSESSSRLEASATTKSKQADTALSAALNEVLAHTTSSGTTAASGTMLSVGKTGTSTTQAQTLRQVSQQLASDLGIKDTSVAQSAIEFGLGIGAGSVGDKLRQILPIKLGANGTQMASNQIDAAVRRATSSLESAGISSVDQVVGSYLRSDDFRRLQTSNAESAHRIASDFQKSTTYRESAGTDVRTAQEHRELAQKAETLSRNLSFNNVVEWNRYLHDRGLEGETDRNALIAVVPGFLQSGTFVGDQDGAMWFKPYQGHGPSSVTLPQDKYRQSKSGERSETNMEPNRDFVMQERGANDHRVRAGAPSTGVNKSFEKSLTEKVDRGLTHIESATGSARDQAAAGHIRVGREFDDAKENVPVTQSLGNQQDGRSAKQQLDQKISGKPGSDSGGRHSATVP
jgi:conjugal transfer mating pair stabilization protein TraG